MSEDLEQEIHSEYQDIKKINEEYQSKLKSDSHPNLSMIVERCKHIIILNNVF